MARSLASRTRRCAPSRTWPTEPGADAISGSNTVWIESTARTSGAISRTRSAIAGSDVSATTSNDGASACSRPGPQPHLLDRLLRAHEQAAGAGRGHPPHRLEQERALADPGLAAEQRDRARDEPTAEHPVQLRDAGGPPRGGDGIDLGQGHDDAGGGGRAVGDGRRALLHQGGPGAALGTAAEPLRRLGVALRAPVDRARPGRLTNTCSGHGGTLPAGCDQAGGRRRRATGPGGLCHRSDRRPLGRVRR